MANNKRNEFKSQLTSQNGGKHHIVDQDPLMILEIVDSVVNQLLIVLLKHQRLSMKNIGNLVMVTMGLDVVAVDSGAMDVIGSGHKIAVEKVME